MLIFVFSEIIFYFYLQGGFTTDTGNSDMEIDIASTPRTDGALFSPTDPFAKIDFTVS